ncbi:MAG TPA: DNA polymerase Y family protein [Novosphingobium sp.]|nr:DNA polymerase Y family protein [Novosphingobium sp.]
MAIWLPALAIDRWQRSEGESPAPFALLAETAHGPRIAAVNAAARDAGVRAGAMLGDARALCPELAVAPGDPGGDLAFIEKLAVWAQRWGPWSALDPPDGLLVDVTGVAHLFGGEAALLADVAARLAVRGLSARPAIAPTAGAAWALAHYGPDRAILPGTGRGTILAEDGGGVRASDPNAARSGPPACTPPPSCEWSPSPYRGGMLNDLPVAALRLDPATLLVLRRLGLKRVGELSGVARDALARRFRSTRAPGANPLIRLDQLLGKVPEPLLPVVAAQLSLVQRRLMEPIRHRSLLDQVLGDLAADMARLLEGQAKGARRLELALWKVDGEVLVRKLELAAASRDAAHIARLFGGKLDDLDAGFGIELARLSAPWCEPLALSQADFEKAAEAHGTSLSACIDRLNARLGEAAVHRPQPVASHLPERAQRWVPPLEPERAVQGELAFHARPLKLLDRPEPIAVLYASPDGLPRRFSWRGQVHEIARAEGPERIAPEWWRMRGTARLRDYYRIEDREGRRYWIYRHGLASDGRGGVPEWYLQGLYA